LRNLNYGLPYWTKNKRDITGIKTYGAFVVLDDHVQGLIHISECKTGVVRALKNELKIGQKVVVTVLDIEQYNNKISLSLRQDRKSKLLTSSHQL